jgi:hypothetical protein
VYIIALMSTTSLEDYANNWIESFEKLLDDLYKHVAFESRLDLPDGIVFWTDQYKELMQCQVGLMRNVYPHKEKRSYASKSGTV